MLGNRNLLTMRFIYVFVLVLFTQWKGYAQIIESDEGCKSKHVLGADVLLKRTSSSSQHKYDLSYYRIDLNITNASIDLSGSCEMGFKAIQPIDTFEFELIDQLQIDSILAQSSSLNFIRSNGVVRVVMPQSVSVGTYNSVRVFYRGTPTTSVGISAAVSSKNSPSWATRTTWTLSQPYGTPQWLPCKQDLSDKIDSMDIHLTVPAGQKAGANGVLQKVDTLTEVSKKYTAIREKTTTVMPGANALLDKLEEPSDNVVLAPESGVFPDGKYSLEAWLHYEKRGLTMPKNTFLSLSHVVAGTYRSLVGKDPEKRHCVVDGRKKYNVSVYAREHFAILQIALNKFFD
jgi:hypothetical protein